MDFNRIANTSERLKMAISNANIKQVDLVNKTGINRSAISRYISGEYEPKQTAIYKLARALNVSEMWLYGYDVPMERPVEQKEMDELADLVDRLKTDKRFRSLVIGLSKMNPDKIESIIKLLDIND